MEAMWEVAVPPQYGQPTPVSLADLERRAGDGGGGRGGGGGGGGGSGDGDGDHRARGRQGMHRCVLPQAMVTPVLLMRGVRKEFRVPQVSAPQVSAAGECAAGGCRR